jgi:hypothetical protein
MKWRMGPDDLLLLDIFHSGAQVQNIESTEAVDNALLTTMRHYALCPWIVNKWSEICKFKWLTLSYDGDFL